MARPSRYEVNGTGRDTYIGNNNGGLYREFRPASAMSQGTFKIASRPEFNLCGFDAKKVGYHTNGTGRDSYIS